MNEPFTLNERKLRGQLSEAWDEILGNPAPTEDVVLTFEHFVVQRSGEARLHEASEAEQLAWFIYFVSTGGCWDGPRGFADKAVLAHASRGPIGEDDSLIVQVFLDPLAPVVSGPLSAEDIVGDPPPTQGDADDQAVRVAEQLLAKASELIPAARAAANAPSS